MTIKIMSLFKKPRSIYLTSYEEYSFLVIGSDIVAEVCGESTSIVNVHPAFFIFNQWQQGMTKQWKWNDCHRHVSRDDRVPWHDNRSYFRQQRQYLLDQYNEISVDARRNLCFGHIFPFIGRNGGFSKEKRYAVWNIIHVLKKKRDAEYQRMLSKNMWWRGNTTGCRALIREHFADYKQKLKDNVCPYVKKLLELGMTYRHVRVIGWIPLVEQANEEYRFELHRMRDSVRVIAANEGWPEINHWSMWWWLLEEDEPINEFESDDELFEYSPFYRGHI